MLGAAAAAVTVAAGKRLGPTVEAAKGGSSDKAQSKGKREKPANGGGGKVHS